VKALAALVLLTAAFLVSDSRAATAPAPSLASLVPPNYRVLSVQRARLSGQSAPEVVVSSVGPLNRYRIHPADLQVFSWDAVAQRWNVAFDAQEVRYPSARLIDPRAEERIGRVRFVRFFPTGRRELVFTTFVPARGSVKSTLVVVDFRNAEAAVAFFWTGASGVALRVVGGDETQRLIAITAYRTVVDPPSRPVRRYRFTIGLHHGVLSVLHDDRPWIGLSVAGTDRSRVAPLGTLRSHLRVLAVVPHSPAAAVFRPGDEILGLTPAGAPWKNDLRGPALIDQIAEQEPGDRVVFTVHRGTDYLRLRLRVGSLIGPSGPGAAPTLNPNFALV
jgi:hypothetical protein